MLFRNLIAFLVLFLDWNTSTTRLWNFFATSTSSTISIFITSFSIPFCVANFLVACRALFNTVGLRNSGALLFIDSGALSLFFCFIWKGTLLLLRVWALFIIWSGAFFHIGCWTLLWVSCRVGSHINWSASFCLTLLLWLWLLVSLVASMTSKRKQNHQKLKIGNAQSNRMINLCRQTLTVLIPPKWIYNDNANGWYLL